MFAIQIPTVFEYFLPVFIYPVFLDRDVEQGAGSSAAKSLSLVATSIGGGGSNSIGWDFGSSGDLGMISVPTSPTSSQSPVVQNHSSRFVYFLSLIDDMDPICKKLHQIDPVVKSRPGLILTIAQ